MLYEVMQFAAKFSHSGGDVPENVSVLDQLVEIPADPIQPLYQGRVGTLARLDYDILVPAHDEQASQVIGPYACLAGDGGKVLELPIR